MNREIAQAHWDEFVAPLIMRMISMYKVFDEQDRLMLEVMELLYVLAMVHGGKHERDDIDADH